MAGGRPSKRTEAIVEKLVSVYKLGVTDEVACNHAGIDKQTLYNWYKVDEDFFDRIQTAKNFARLAAGNVVMNSIVKKKDINTAKWWLEKKHSGEFKNKPEEREKPTQQIHYNLNILAHELAGIFKNTDSRSDTGEAEDVELAAEIGALAEGSDSKGTEV